MVTGLAFGEVAADRIYPHELAYREAASIVLARVVSFDPERGVLVDADTVIRGAIPANHSFYLKGTGSFPFLNAPGTPLTIFLRSFEGKEQAVLWQGPTTGGMIWGDHETVDLIAAAAADPETSMTAPHPRERFSAAYYIAMRGGLTPETGGEVVERLIWGVARKEPEINQAAVDALNAAGIDIARIAGPYHPGIRPQLKYEAAQKLKAWWEERKE